MKYKNKIVAITGQSGSGKSTLASFYASKGLTVLDCDQVAKEVHGIKECLDNLSEYFGDDIITAEGTLDKKLLSKRAFASRQATQALTDITHPFIIRLLLEKAQAAFDSGENIVFADGAVIIGHDFEQYCDEFIVVVAGLDVQCERIMKRDGITREQAEERISQQTPIIQMIKKADYIVYNNSTLEKLFYQGELILQQITKI